MTRWMMAAALLGGLAAPALAQAVDRDVRCLVASNAFSKVETDAKKRGVAQAAFFFYLGRVDGRIAPAALKRQLLAQATGLTQANLGTTMTDCARAFVAKQAEVQALAQQVAPAKK